MSCGSGIVLTCLPAAESVSRMNSESRRCCCNYLIMLTSDLNDLFLAYITDFFFFLHFSSLVECLSHRTPIHPSAPSIQPALVFSCVRFVSDFCSLHMRKSIFILSCHTWHVSSLSLSLLLESHSKRHVFTPLYLKYRTFSSCLISRSITFQLR